MCHFSPPSSQQRTPTITYQHPTSDGSASAHDRSMSLYEVTTSGVPFDMGRNSLSSVVSPMGAQRVTFESSTTGLQPARLAPTPYMAVGRSSQMNMSSKAVWSDQKRITGRPSSYHVP